MAIDAATNTFRQEVKRREKQKKRESVREGERNLRGCERERVRKR